MNSPSADHDASTARKSRLRSELIYASVWLGVGFFVMPALIYTVGMLLLGPYGENAGLRTFYADYFGDLAEPEGRAWILALGPLILISILRLVFLNYKTEPPAGEAERNEAPPRTHTRVEPRVSGE